MISRLPIGILDSNCYVISDPHAGLAAIVDPGFQSSVTPSGSVTLHAQLRALAVTPCLILNTHGHFDHIIGNASLVTAQIPLGIHPLDVPLLLSGGAGASFGFAGPASPAPTLSLIDGLELSIGSLHVRVIHTPGHTPGSVCLYVVEDEALITGDTLFEGSVGRTDLPGGDPRALTHSLVKLLDLAPNTRVYPGHGAPTTMARELRSNPWLRRLKPQPA